LQAEPWTGEGRSSESGSYEAREIKATTTNGKCPSRLSLQSL
jgi:hypothetical protein